MSGGDPPRSNPMVEWDDCCARATSGHAAAPPRAAMNSRRLMAIPPERER